MDTVEGRTCFIDNPEAFCEPTRLSCLASWLLNFGMDIGTIPNSEEKEADFIGKEKA